MAEEKVIRLSEFKVIMEEVRSQHKKIIEVMQHHHERTDKRLDRLEEGMNEVKGDIRVLKGDVCALKGDVRTLRDEVALLHEGQTEIKETLFQKVDRAEFSRLEKRVAKLERRSA